MLIGRVGSDQPRRWLVGPSGAVMGSSFGNAYHHRSPGSRNDRELVFGTGTRRPGSLAVDHLHVLGIESGHLPREADPHPESTGHDARRRGLDLDRESVHVQRAGEERCHLTPGDGIVGAVASRCGAATRRDPRRGQGVDIGGVGVALDVDEPGRRAGVEIESAGEEGCHLSAGDGIVGAVASRCGITTRRDPQHRETLHVRRPPPIGIDIGETGGGRNRVLAVEDPDQPHCHHPTLQRSAGAELPRSAVRTLQNPRRRQPFDPRPVRTRLIQIREPRIGRTRGTSTHHRDHHQQRNQNRRTPARPDHPHEDRQDGPGPSA